MTSDSNAFLGTQPMGRLMRKFAVPCVVSLLFGALYNIVDQIFIANADYLGSYGNASNSVVFPLTVIALALATMLGDGCCALVSLSLGAGHRDDARRSVGTAVVTLVLVSLVLTAVYLIWPEQILTMFGARVNAETFRLSREYFFYIALGVPFYIVGQALNPIIRSDGSPRFAMLTLLAGALTNCALDPLFIYGFHWGMMGAAVATVAGQIVSAAMAVGYLFRMKAVKLDRDAFKPRVKLLSRILPLGVTSFLSQISIVLSMAAVLNMAAKYGSLDPIFGMEEYAQIPAAVIGIVMKFFQIVVSISIGMAAGCIPLIGYNMGAGKPERVHELLVRLTVAELIVGIIATLICELFPYPLIAIFGAANESVHYTNFAVRCIRLFMLLTPLACINKSTFIFLQAMGKPVQSTLLSMLREVAFGVGLPLLLPLFWGLDGLIWFMTAADILTLPVTIAAILSIRRQLKALPA